jgi:hypothetical protein
MERMMESQTSGIRRELAVTPAAGLEGIIKNVFAHLTEAPTNWHQCVVYYLTSDAPEDAAAKRYVPAMFFTSCESAINQTAVWCPLCTSSSSHVY